MQHPGVSPIPRGWAEHWYFQTQSANDGGRFHADKDMKKSPEQANLRQQLAQAKRGDF